MARILRGEVYWADLNPVRGREQAGKRPVLVISHDVFNEHGTVIALALTSQPQRVQLPLALQVQSIDLPRPSWVKISQVRTLSTERLGSCLGRISAAELQDVIEGLIEIVA